MLPLSRPELKWLERNQLYWVHKPALIVFRLILLIVSLKLYAMVVFNIVLPNLEKLSPLILDAAPEYVFPAKVSFVADVAQFTPKTVETATEREKLMFRVRAQIPQDLLEKYILRVKTGLPGVAYVLEDSQGEWPEHLAVRIP